MTTTTQEPVPPEKTAGGSGLSPRQWQQISRSAQYALFVVIIVLAVALADWGKIRASFLNVDATENMFPKLFTVALRNTVIYTMTAYAVGFVLGLIVALMRLSSVAPYRWFGLIFIEIFRGLPGLL